MSFPGPVGRNQRIFHGFPIVTIGKDYSFPSWYEPEYVDILNYAKTVPGCVLPSGACQANGNNLIYRWKLWDVWNQKDLFYNFLTDGNDTFAKINWRSPGSYVADGTGHEPIFLPNVGFVGNGSTMYLDTQWAGTNGVKFANDSGYGFDGILNRNPSGYRAMCGATNGVTPTCIAEEGTAVTDLYLSVRGVSISVTQSNLRTGGIYHMSKPTGTLTTFFRNGLQFHSQTHAVGTLHTYTVYLLGRNALGALSEPADATLRMWYAGASMGGKVGAILEGWEKYKAGT